MSIGMGVWYREDTKKGVASGGRHPVTVVSVPCPILLINVKRHLPTKRQLGDFTSHISVEYSGYI
jgi:hypothetical protein